MVLGVALENFVETGVALEETARRLEELLALDDVPHKIREGTARGVVPLGRKLQGIARRRASGQQRQLCVAATHSLAHGSERRGRRGASERIYVIGPIW